MTYDEAVTEARKRYDSRDKALASPIYRIMRLNGEHIVVESDDSVSYAEQLGWSVVGRCYDETSRRKVK